MAELWPLTRHTHDERFMEGTPPPKTPKRGGDHQRRRKIYIVFMGLYNVDKSHEPPIWQ